MKQFKLSVNVPLSHSDDVRAAIGNAGGGKVGEYTHCSFSTRGTGRFKPSNRAQPHIGQAGQLERVEEEKIEVYPIAEGNLKDVVDALKKAHPYEESNYYIQEILTL